MRREQRARRRVSPAYKVRRVRAALTAQISRDVRAAVELANAALLTHLREGGRL